MTSHSWCRVAAVAATLGLASCAAPLEKPAPPTLETPPAAEPQPPAKPPAPPVTLRIAAVGDIMLGTDYPQNHLPDDDGAGFFAGVSEFLTDADVAFGNLEGVLSDGGQPEKICKNPDVCYLFRSPTRYADHLAAAGFDVMSLANNHARDFGEAGRDETMCALSERGVHHAGREGDVASWTVKGVSIALAAFSPNKGSYSINDSEGGTAIVRELAREHDIVIVSFHGGAEGLDALHLPFGLEIYYGEHRGDLVAFSHAVIDAGADLVLGHGPHVPRAVEIYADRLIAYSLGNFATYYGISVEGLKGVAPILYADLSQSGEFLSGKIVSTHQIRPAGPTLDATSLALTTVRRLTREDFGENEVVWADDGTFTAGPGDPQEQRHDQP